MAIEEIQKRFRSINRAIRRGNVDAYGMFILRRPFNNRANTCKRRGKTSRANNEYKKSIYAALESIQ